MKAWRVAFTAARAAAVMSVIATLVRGGKAAKPLLPAPPPDVPHRLISVVVSARNEAGRIGPLLEALQTMVSGGSILEAIVVDDGSSDSTAQMSILAGARVVMPGPVPVGWAGKPWAIEQGVLAAMGEWIVTFDADVRPSTPMPSAAVERCVADDIDLLTLAPAIECPTVGAAWLHPSMLTTLVYRFGRPGVDVAPDRMLANGQCMVFRRSWFLDGGGFGAARSASEEDVAFARLAARRGDRVGFLDAPDLLVVRAYEDFAHTLLSWGRSIGLASVTPRARRTLHIVTLALVMPLPWLRLALRRADVVDAAALATRLGTLVGTAGTYPTARATRRLVYYLSPLADPLAWLAMAAGSIGRRRTWRGRTL
ncbi:MAG TPA: glycosyltransferase [Ilumatobacter sp.]|nr:glycosyltransferase [Ilumatobacter sp.]